MAIAFNGSTDKLEIPSANFFGQGGGYSFPWTMACRFLPDGIAASYVLVRLWNISLGDERYLQFAGHVAGDPLYWTHLDAGVSSDTVATGASGIAAGSWYAVAGVAASASSRTRRLEGVSVAGSGASVQPTGYNVLHVGHYVSNNYHDGLMCAIGLWNGALSDAEMDSLRAGFPVRRIRPQSLLLSIDGVRMIIDRARAVAITVTGTSVADHPRSYGY